MAGVGVWLCRKRVLVTLWAMAPRAEPGQPTRAARSLCGHSGAPHSRGPAASEQRVTRKRDSGGMVGVGFGCVDNGGVCPQGSTPGSRPEPTRADPSRPQPLRSQLQNQVHPALGWRRTTAREIKESIRVLERKCCVATSTCGATHEHLSV